MQTRFFLALTLALSACSGSSEETPVTPDGGGAEPSSSSVNSTETAPSGPPQFAAQPGWTEQAPSSAMRFKEFVLCGDETPGPDHPVVIVAHWPNGVGGRDGNLARWKGNVAPLEGGAPVGERSETWNGLDVSIVDGSGQINDMGSAFDDGRFIAAYIESGSRSIEGVYTVKLSGPRAQVDTWADSLYAFLAAL